MTTLKKQRTVYAKKVRTATGLSFVDAHRAVHFLQHGLFKYNPYGNDLHSDGRKAPPAFGGFEYYQPPCDCCDGFPVPYVFGPKGRFSPQ